MAFITLGVTVELCQPPFPSICWCCAVLAAFMTMPKTAVDKNHRLEFRQDDVGPARQLAVMQTETITHPMEQ